MNTATLRLFNAIQVDTRQDGPISPSLLERTVRNGYLLDPAIRPDEGLLDTIERVVGISGEKANAAFHKSWTVVQSSPMEQLVMHQIVHYLTTYGFETLGLYQQDTVYIPCETLALPQITEDMPLVVIKALDAQQVLERIIGLGSSGIALAPETLDDVMTIVRANAYESGFVQRITNRELKALLSDLYHLVPSDPVEFLRYLIGKLTGESLLIKNAALIQKIKAADGLLLDSLLENAPDDLGSIFLRFKPLFLALKSISGNKTFFNRLRKQAVHLHRPLPPDYLNSVTAQIKRGELDLDVLARRVRQASIFRRVHLAYALQFRQAPAAKRFAFAGGDSIVYRVRNGRGWVTAFQWAADWEETRQQAFEIVLSAIVEEVRKNVAGKTIYIPAHVHYALPATEKQFTGHLPTGSSVSVPHDLIVGIHWTNTAQRVDLDLSVVGAFGKIGWDAAYRSQDKRILFSGDVTDAPPPQGASELFYLQAGIEEAALLMANYFNFQKGDQVECRLIAAQEEPKSFDKNYMVDVNNIVATANIHITKRQNILGLIAHVEGENRVYFANVSVGNTITSGYSEQSTRAVNYLVKSLAGAPDLGEVLRLAGAHVVDRVPDGEYLDLSPEALDKGAIIGLISPQPVWQQKSRT